MDVKVYEKEEVYQPSGTAEVLTPDIIDIIPDIQIIDGKEYISGCAIVEGNNEIEQQCALATIFQRGLDPLDTEDGIQWSETLLGEVNVLQLMEQIIEAVSKVSLHVKVEFSTVVSETGQTVLSYALKEVA